ncbi:hypothetical protein J1N35_000215 [Gossypium stocksii]|uniref:Uncharacterized protein n=1 Tax=Gossypium stocksii TaxID=47602 RepID=A0A9D4AJX1_9ROSI|nr:hypothetical protein J1N35_000215 [Gossypium stocksii]
MHFVVEKVRMKLQSWDARQLSIAGRATLGQSVLLSIPGYFMQSKMIPKKICDEIESLARWDSICQPMECGGLGIRQLCD